MSSKTKSVTAVLIVLALVAGVGMTKVGSKYKTQDKVNLIFANATSNSAKKAGEKFKELVEEYSDGDITVDLFPDNQLGDDKTVAEGVQNTVPAYAASKGGVAQITKAFCNEWAEKGINVNSIAPGYMATEMNTALLDPKNPRKEAITNRIPAKRWGTAEDMKGPCVFLASDASDYLNGAVIPVDGGYLVR
jgi:NAD(P)-dependent dehydrogenase (short-subunit alcohol dehydrogenase family)